MGYVVFRGGLETVTYLPVVISWLLLVWLTTAQAQGGFLDAAGYQAMGAMMRELGATGFAVSQIVFPLGALMFYYLLYQARLIPRWLSGWGLIMAIPYLAAGLLVVVQLLDDTSTTHSLLVMPLGLQELVMAVWLIVKGFSPTAIASTPATDAAAVGAAPREAVGAGGMR